MRKGIMFVSSRKCVACKRCSMACAVAHSAYKDFFELVAAEGSALSCVVYRPVGQRVIPLECRHCEGAACAVACPTGAIGRSDEGAPVILDAGLCVGCRSCVVACPYGAVRVASSTGEIYKCDFCIERTAAGQIPACVEACPTRCLTYETVDKLEDEYNVAQEVFITLAQNAVSKGE